MILIYSPWLGKFRRHVRRNIRIFSNLIYDFAILSAMISCYYSIYPERIMFLNKYNNTLYAHKEYNKAVNAHRSQSFWMSHYFYSLISNTMNNSNVFDLWKNNSFKDLPMYPLGSKKKDKLGIHIRPGYEVKIKSGIAIMWKWNWNKFWIILVIFLFHFLFSFFGGCCFFSWYMDI